MTKIMMNPSPENSMMVALLNPLFPEVDSLLRTGYHISVDKLELHSYLVDYSDALEQFYQRYNVELIHAPESFFYLRPRSTTLIARSSLSELEMMLGKILCYLYLSPERLAQEGVFSVQDLYDELTTLVDERKLLRYANQRSAGSDLDKQKLFDKVKTALNRLRRMGIVTFTHYENQRFIISEAVFRFGMDVRTGENKQQAQLRLIRDGEAVYYDEQEVTLSLDEDELQVTKESEESEA